MFRCDDVLGFYSFVILIILIRLSNATQPSNFPIGTEIDRHLPSLGSTVRNLPPNWRRRGFWDPHAQILCDGELPPGSIPRQFLPVDQTGRPAFGEIYTHMRSLCAKVRYGGTTSAWTAGGYCAFAAGSPTVVFEELPPGGREMDRSTKEIFLLCQHSCRCIEGQDTRDLIVQGKPATIITKSESINAQEIYTNPESYPISEPLPPRASLYSTYPPLLVGRGPYIPIYFVPEVDARRIGPASRVQENYKATTLWVPPFPAQYAPECSGKVSVPVFDENGVSAQQACSAEWFGGARSGNVGLVCTNPGVGPFQIRLVQQKHVAHPVYRPDPRFPTPLNQFEEIKQLCRNLCKCSEPKENPVVQSAILVKGAYEAAKDFIHAFCRPGQVANSDSSCGGRLTGVSSGSRYRGINSNLRRSSLCRVQKVDGFDLAASVAAQSLCR